MPIRIPSLGNDGQMPAIFAGIHQQLAGLALHAAGQNNQSSQGVDQYGNTTHIVGQLNQTAVVGAGWIGGQPVSGVLVQTGLTGVGIAYVAAFAQTTIDTTEDSTTATVTSASGLVEGMQCGANIADLLADTYDEAVSPGTSIASIAGETIELSQPAALTASGAYFCAVTWAQLNAPANP